MALSKIQKSAFQNTKKQIKLIVKEIEKDALAKVNSAITCGALGEDSTFLRPNNNLLAKALIENVSKEYQLQSSDYRAEANNLNKFI